MTRRVSYESLFVQNSSCTVLCLVAWQCSGYGGAQSNCQFLSDSASNYKIHASWAQPWVISLASTTDCPALFVVRPRIWFSNYTRKFEWSCKNYKSYLAHDTLSLKNLSSFFSQTINWRYSDVHYILKIRQDRETLFLWSWMEIYHCDCWGVIAVILLSSTT